MGFNPLTRLRRKIKMVLRSAWTSQHYWKARERVQLLWFKVLRKGFYTGTWADGKKHDLRDWWIIFKGGLRSTCLATVLFFITEYGDAVFDLYLPAVHTLACNWTTSALSFFSLKLDYSSESVSGLLSSVSGVAGAFLGLYFTAVSIGIGQELTTLSLGLRALVVSERLGTKYISHLTILTVFSFLLWLKVSVAGNLTLLSLVAVVCVSIYLISGFYPLGTRSFFLAEPSSLAGPLFFDIYRYLKKLRKRDLFSSYGPIENYFRETVRGKLLTLKQVMKLALQKGERGADDARKLAFSLVSMLLYYRGFKQNISTESKWFDAVPKHDNWLYPDSTKETMLHNMGVVLQPPTAPDKEWLEKEVTAILKECLVSFQKTPHAIIPTASVLRSYFNSLSLGWDIDHAIGEYKVFADLVNPIFSNKEDIVLKIQIQDLLNLCRIEIAIHALRCVEDFSSLAALDAITDFIFGKTNTLDRHVPENVRTITDHLRKTITFETAVEGKVLTPRWFVHQLLARAYIEEIKKIFSKLVNFVDPSMDSAADRNEAILVAMRKQREIELVSRIENMRVHFEHKIAELKAFQKISDYPILEMPKDYESKTLEKFRAVQFDSLADIIVKLYQVERDDALPDFFGLCFRHLVQELFYRLETNDAKGFQAIFPKVFLAAFLAKDRLMLDQKNQSDDVAKTRIAFEPVVDLLHLSGYAAAFSDLHGDSKLNEVVWTFWKSLTKMFSNLDTQEKIVDWIIHVHQFQISGFSITATSHLRFSWKQRFEEILRAKGFISDRYRYNDDDVQIPDKPLLKAICDGGYEPREEPTEWFIVSVTLREKLDQQKISLNKIRFWNDYQRSEREK